MLCNVLLISRSLLLEVTVCICVHVASLVVGIFNTYQQQRLETVQKLVFYVAELSAALSASHYRIML